MNDVVAMFQQFKSDREKQEFIAAQHKTLSFLMEENQRLQTEVEHLKTLLGGMSGTFIVSPEEALIESQVKIIHNRSFGQELDLEDVKKLDLLLKNLKIIRESSKTIKAEPVVQLSGIELLKLAKTDDGL